MQIHIAEQRVKDCERQLQAVHAAAQTLADEKGDLHAQVATLEEAMSDKASVQDRAMELEARVSHCRPLLDAHCCPSQTLLSSILVQASFTLLLSG